MGLFLISKLSLKYNNRINPIDQVNIVIKAKPNISS
jgi:hypothetical protein